MERSPRKKRYTLQQREQFVEEFRRSGLAQAEFCRRVRLHPVTFSRWRREAMASVPVFAEVQVSALAPGDGVAKPALGGAAVLHLVGGARLEVALGAESAWTGLGRMLKALQC
jgi:hypothetical protein